MQHNEDSARLAQRLLVLTLSLAQSFDQDDLNGANALMQEREHTLSELETAQLSTEAELILKRVADEEVKLLVRLESEQENLIGGILGSLKEREAARAYSQPFDRAS